MAEFVFRELDVPKNACKAAYQPNIPAEIALSFLFSGRITHNNLAAVDKQLADRSIGTAVPGKKWGGGKSP